MADPINYTGVTYDPNFFRGSDETMVDYMTRLIDDRPQGVLGTSSGVALDVPEITKEVLGEVVQNCPAGYTWNGTECVLAAPMGGSGGDSSGDMPKGQARAQNNNFGFIDPTLVGAVGGLFGPLGGLIGRGLAEWNNSAAIGTAQDLAQIPEANRSSTWGQSLTSNIGNVDLNGKTYGVSLGGVTGTQPGIIERLFSFGDQPLQNPTLTLTPREVNLRRGMLNWQQNQAAQDAANAAAVQQTIANAAANRAAGGTYTPTIAGSDYSPNAGYSASDISGSGSSFSDTYGSQNSSGGWGGSYADGGDYAD